MRIAYRFGHNELCQGANGLVNEVIEDRHYGQKVIQLLQQVGNQCYNCTPPPMADSNAELTYGTNMENQISPKCDLFISDHINANDNPDAHGAEMLICDATSSPNANATAQRILTNLQGIGITNRGVKETGTNFNDIRQSNAEAIIIEPFFLTNQGDVNIYQTKFELFCRAIANGIDNRVSLTSPTQTQSTLPDRLTIDNPKTGFTTSATFELNGWALSSANEIELILNGKSCGKQKLSVSRPDVIKAFPQYKKPNNIVGFKWGINIADLKTGENTLTVWSGNANQTIKVIRK